MNDCIKVANSVVRCMNDFLSSPNLQDVVSLFTCSLVLLRRQAMLPFKRFHLIVVLVFVAVQTKTRAIQGRT